MLALIIPILAVFGCAQHFAESWWQRRKKEKRPVPARSRRKRADTEATITAEAIVHQAYDTWYAAPDHPTSLTRLPTP
ncbi:hypothetical protein [Streptomyces sp. NPDC005407]|uniref:hypothetical protein n=1 Tax=Streptomyces sp. NPDC005407 TaxID=3155340 RepID=UPI0033B184FC